MKLYDKNTTYRISIIVTVAWALIAISFCIKGFFDPDYITANISLLYGVACLIFSFTLCLFTLILLEHKSRSHILKITLNNKEFKTLITEEIKKQLPDADRLFAHFKLFITICIFLFTAMIALILKYLK